MGKKAREKAKKRKATEECANQEEIVETVVDKKMKTDLTSNTFKTKQPSLDVLDCEPVETSIEFWLSRHKDLKFGPNETHDVNICWGDSPSNGPTMTKITGMELCLSGLEIVSSFWNPKDRPVRVSRFKLDARVLLKNSSPDEIEIKKKTIVGKITKATFGPYSCTVLKLDEEGKILTLKYFMQNEWKSTKIECFDVKNPIKSELKGKFWYLNTYSKMLLEALQWPKQILFIFESEQEATKCLNVIFPKPFEKNNEISKLKLKVHIMEDAENKTSLISEKMLKNEIEYFDGKEIFLSDLVQNWLTMDLMDEKSCRIVNLEQKITEKKQEFVQKQKEMNQIETEITQLQLELQAAKNEKETQEANGEMEEIEDTEMENSEKMVEENDKKHENTGLMEENGKVEEIE